MTGVRTSPAVVGSALTGRLRRYQRPAPVVAPLLASDALKCSRRIGFRLFGTPADIRYTRAELARFEEGDYIDSVAAEVFAQKFNARTQVPFHWLPQVPLKGKADAGYRNGLAGSKHVVEVKSQNEKGWARAVGMWDNVPGAPKVEWLVQAGLAACSPMLAADYVHIVLVDNDRLEVAEWVIGVDDPLDLPDWPAEVDEDTGEIVQPTVRSLTHAELGRQAEILTLCEDGTLPERNLPGFGVIDTPPPRDDQYGQPWACKYCQWQPTCATLPTRPVAEFAEMPD